MLSLLLEQHSMLLLVSIGAKCIDVHRSWDMSILVGNSAESALFPGHAPPDLVRYGNWHVKLLCPP